MGIPVTDEAGQRLGHSVTAAKQGIFQVVISRIGMAIPAMGEAGLAGGAQEARGEDGMRFSGAFDNSEPASLGRMGEARREVFPRVPGVHSINFLTALLSPSHSPSDHEHPGKESLPEGKDLTSYLFWPEVSDI